jgi:hypothetical protein
VQWQNTVFSQCHSNIYEKTGEEVILMKDKTGLVIGFEKLNYSIPVTESENSAFETVSA